MTDEQKREDGLRRTMAALRAKIERLWTRGNRESDKLVQSGLYDQEQQLRSRLWQETERLLDKIAQHRRHLPPFMVYRDGYYEMMPVTPELIAQAEHMDQEARR